MNFQFPAKSQEPSQKMTLRLWLRTPSAIFARSSQLSISRRQLTTIGATKTETRAQSEQESCPCSKLDVTCLRQLVAIERKENQARKNRADNWIAVGLWSSFVLVGGVWGMTKYGWLVPYVLFCSGTCSVLPAISLIGINSELKMLRRKEGLIESNLRAEIPRIWECQQKKAEDQESSSRSSLQQKPKRVQIVDEAEHIMRMLK